MRSSESANSASTAISVRIRCLLGRNRMVASATSQKAISSGCQRARPARYRLMSGAIVGVVKGLPPGDASSGGSARKQALRAPDQDHDHDGVDDEGPELRHVVLA